MGFLYLPPSLLTGTPPQASLGPENMVQLGDPSALAHFAHLAYSIRHGTLAVSLSLDAVTLWRDVWVDSNLRLHV